MVKYLKWLFLFVFIVFTTNALADNNKINGTCPGEIIEEINGATASVSHTENGAIGGGGNDRYRMTFNTAGTLDIDVINRDLNRNADYRFYISRNSCGNNNSDWNIVSNEVGKSHHHTVTVHSGDTIYVRLQSIASEPNRGRHAYALALNFTSEKITNFSAPMEVNPGQTITVTVSYHVAQTREIVTGFQQNHSPWQGWGWTSVQVPAGSGTVNLSITIPNDQPLGNNYQIPIILRPIGGNWNTRLDNKSINPVNLIAVSNNPPVANATVTPTSGAEGTSFSFDGSGSTDDGGANNLSYVWKEGGTTLSSSATFSKSDFSEGNHTVTLTVTDAGGLSDSTDVTISIMEVVENADDPEFVQCGLFPSVLNTWENIERGNQDIVVDSDTIYADNVNGNGGSSQEIQCNTADGTRQCDVLPMPESIPTLPTFISSPISEAYTATNTETNASYGDVTVNTDTHFSPSGTYTNGKPVMLIHSLTVHNGATMTFDAGDYWIGSLTANQGVTIRTNGKVRLFIGSDLLLNQNHLDINYDNGNGLPGNLFIFVYGNVEWASAGGGYQQDMTAYLFTNGTYTANMDTANSHFKGAITAVHDINLNNNQEYIYDDSGLIDGWGECCILIQFDRDHYDVSENINEIGTLETVHPLIILSRPSQEDITVHYRTIDGTAKASDGDYVPVDTAITIPAGDINVSIPIQVYNDAPIELDENFTVELYDPVNACLGEQNTTQINILAQEDAPVCFEDDFSNGLDSKWRVLHNPNSDSPYTPQVVNVNGDARLRLTDRSHALSSVITKDYEFETSHNLIIVEFDYYNYGGCANGYNHHNGNMGDWGADGIVNVLFNSNRPDGTPLDSPVPGGTGGSLGYAQIIRWNGQEISGFEQGWLGLGIDEYGNFARANEGKEGGIPSDDRTINAISIRGDGQGMDGYEYLAGTETLSPPLAAKLGDDYGPDGYYSGKYKFTVDARDPNHLYLRLERSLTGDPADYQVIIEQFDAKAPGLGQGPTPEKVRYAISSGTGGGCNNHEISWIKLRGNCAAYGTQHYATGPFDAWDTNRGINDRNISTKKVNDNFNLVLASLNADQSGVETKNASNRVYYGLIKPKTDNTTGYDYLVNPVNNPPLDFTNPNHPTYTKTFNVGSAVNNTQVVFRFCADFNGTTYTLYPPDVNCTGQANIVLWPDEHNIVGWREVLSSDNFAIRPDHFVIDQINGPIKAGKDFNVTIHAVDSQGNDVNDYNETVNIWGASPTFDHNDTNSSCATGVLTKVTGNFNNGHALVTMNYSEVGNLNFLLTEHKESDYAHVDLDDTDYNITTHDSPNHAGSIYREITPASRTVRFIPDHFDLLNVALHDFHEGSDANFTYLASSPPPAFTQIDQPMAATLDMDIVAKTANNTTTANYNKGCYAQDLTSLSLSYLIDGAVASTANPGILTHILYRWYDDALPLHTNQGNTALGSFVDVTGGSSITKNIFGTDHNGTSKLKIQLNFNRNYRDTVNPFKLSITDINVTDRDNVTDINNSAKADHNATFLYARAKASQDFYDNMTPTSAKTPIMVLVYCNKWPASDTNCPGGIDFSKGAAVPDWWLAPSHITGTDDGNVTLSVSGASESVAPASISITAIKTSIDKNITVSYTGSSLPHTVNVDLVDTGPAPFTNSWLIYNPANTSTKPSPFYRVRFIGTMGWAGKGDTGHVVDTNSTTIENRKMGW